MKIHLFIFLVLLLAACEEARRPVANFDDYEKYLTNSLLVDHDPQDKELQFWNERLRKNPNDENSLLKLAGLHSEKFRTSGLFRSIQHSDSLYTLALNQYSEGNAEILQSLATNAIAQHKFLDARNYAEKALALKDKKAGSLLILVDVSLEIGDYARANKILNQFKNKNSFAYLIRKAKAKDHEGMSDSAIACMEKAYSRIKGNKELAQWTLSNLADMYGHAGLVEAAYDTYLEVLRINPAYDHALKGIAWICISHDNNLRDARKIINALATRTFMPESHLWLALISEMENNEFQKKQHLDNFKSLVSGKDYKSMYKKYLTLVEAEEYSPAIAIGMAEEEIKNRPTPDSFDLLAWSYYHHKDFKKALDIATSKVKDQTFEPQAVYHLGMIYLANGDHMMAKEYLNKALDSEFELGPPVTKQIKFALQGI